MFSHNCLQNHCFAFCQNGLGMLCGQHGCQRCRKGDPWHQKWTNLAPKWSSLATTWLLLGRLLANMAAQMCQVGHYLVPSSSVLVTRLPKVPKRSYLATKTDPKQRFWQVALPTSAAWLRESKQVTLQHTLDQAMQNQVVSTPMVPVLAMPHPGHETNIALMLQTSSGSAAVLRTSIYYGA